MKISERILTTALAAGIALSLISCADKESEGKNNGSIEYLSTGTTSSQAQSLVVPDVEYPVSYKSSDDTVEDGTENAVIKLCGDHAEISEDGTGASVSGSIVTIKTAGTYVISGALDNGQIIVDSEDEEKITLLLNGVDIKCAGSSPIYIKSAPKKAVIKLCEKSVNLITDGTSYTEAEDMPSAAIFSKDDLKISGSGELYVTGNYNKGIFTKDDLEIDGGSIYVTAVDDAVRGKDSVTVSGGKLVLTAGADGIRTSNTENAEKGNIIIDGGEIYITSENDAIEATNTITINGGIIAVQAGGGYENSNKSSSGDMGRPGGFGGFGGFGGGTSTSTEPSDHGIKSEGVLTVNGGTISVDCSADAFHSSAEIDINDGDILIKAGDDGLHADNLLYVKGGIITVSTSYEGYEAQKVYISGGTTRITSSDDGINAAGGTTTAGGGLPGSNSTKSGTYLLAISGGYTVVNAAGDGIDSNGDIEMTGGTMLVFGPTDSGNGPIDFGDSNNKMTISDGLLLAVGSSGMAEAATGLSQQVLFATTGNLSAGTVLAVTDSSGNAVIAMKLPKSVQCIVFSSPQLVSGASYTVYSGGDCTGTLTDNVYTGGSYTTGVKITSTTATTSPSTGGFGGGGFGGGGGWGGR